jgi:hypothetical protein
MERLSPARLFEDQLQAPSSSLYWVFGVAFIVLLLGSFYVYLQAPRRFQHDPRQAGLACRYAALVGTLSGLGLASIVFAFQTAPFVSKRIWLVAALAGLVVTACRGALELTRRRPEG